MTVSQNGWPASPDKTAIGVVSPVVYSVDFPQGVKSGDVQTVLMYVAKRFHQSVEPLQHDGWCWGYLYRQIEGSTALSNHSSGTAIDLNAPNHPLGSVGTFDAGQVKAIRSILDFCEGTVRWGGDYAGRKDEMHFEINRGPEDVARIARKIKALDVVIGGTDMPTAKEIWAADVVPSGDPKNPTWGAAWAVGELLRRTARAEAYAKQAAGVDLDAQEVADYVLAGLGAKDANTVATALKAALTPEQARTVGELLIQ